MIIYVDKENGCHVDPQKETTPIETSFFNGKSKEFIEGYCCEVAEQYMTFYPTEDFNEIMAAQQKAQEQALASLGVVSDTLLENGVKAVRNTLDKVATKVEDVDAYDFYEVFPLWSGAGISYSIGYRVRYNDEDCIFKCKQEHISQDDWDPISALTLWERLDETHKGTKEDPIPAGLGMKYYKDLYYLESDTLYLCIRDSETELYHLPNELVGLYFEKI